MVATRASAFAEAMSTRRTTRGMMGSNTTLTASQVRQLKKQTTMPEGSKKTPNIRNPATKVVKANKKEQTSRTSRPPIFKSPATKVVKADKKAQIPKFSHPRPSRRSTRLLARKAPLHHSIGEVQAPGVNSEMTTVVDDLREVVDHDANLPPIPDNSAEGQEELETTGEHPPTANVPAMEEEEQDDPDPEIDAADMLYNPMLMVWDELSVEQRLSVLRVSEAVHSGDAADILEYNDLPLGHRAKVNPLVANTFNSIRAEKYYRGVAALGQGFRLRLSTSLRPLTHFQI
ncbi:hypothetical protein JADG_008173 [Aureobasidium aubasidani]|nr:hypothetical protein JADG_008173 [Aureobasidium pullulans]